MSVTRAVLTHGPSGNLPGCPTNIGAATSIMNSCHRSPSALPCPGAHSAIKTTLRVTLTKEVDVNTFPEVLDSSLVETQRA